ncbi:SDR family NAD(P)-dependent oxidoreductase [Fluviispira multicolorata]|uniref:SDR family NAD(P)-dependent oxidoreductase n=1 Tax=Fluviispira multicolorata TaxID=2654512 RepID=A0A833N4Z4_9BACT|nr:SDR family NAD(P)-dependent oxidoreductase [Fluviispira multicolorata]KAB8031958.1 SDR family NAD(P)-dependent oxidoreductase [Fluviispira multicolorata]
MKIKTIWQGKEYPHNWEFYAECDEGEKIQISVKNGDAVKIAPNPKELVLQGMASCTSVDVISTLQKMRQPLEELIVECDAEQTTVHPKVFEKCNINYYVNGKELNVEKVANAVFLSFTKYCGVSAMLEKSGCHMTPKLFVNNKEIDIFDPENKISDKLKHWIKDVANNCSNGVALVTGASRGIGNALVKQLSQEDFAVIPTARSKVLYENTNIFDSLYLDVTKPNSISYLSNFLKKNSIELNLIVHNAGVFSLDSGADSLDVNYTEIHKIYEANVFGLIEANNKFMQLMSSCSTIAFVSSLMGHDSYDTYSYAAYRMSKRSVIQFAKNVALQFQNQNKKICILSLHPGSVKTDMNPSGKISVENSAKNISYLLSNKMLETRMKNNGGFWNFDLTKEVWECLK